MAYAVIYSDASGTERVCRFFYKVNAMDFMSAILRKGFKAELVVYR